ncbi:DNA helicase, partial [Kibdelosporangium lantanae]
GSAVGGVAGAVAGTFAEKLLTPKTGQSKNGGSKPRTPRLDLTAAALYEFVAELAAAMGVGDVLRVSGVRVKCVQVRIRDADEPGEQNFLNSFIADDLARIETAVRDDDIGQGLRGYLADLRDIPVRSRVDVRHHPGAVVTSVEPVRIPAGRWPAATTRPLVMSQQFAVDQIMRELGDSAGVFAVYGPPGTGKTTMLRDVIAAVLVERGRR